jgi:hypothetical protein
LTGEDIFDKPTSMGRRMALSFSKASGMADGETQIAKARRTALGFITIGVGALSILGAMAVSHFAFGVPFHDKFGNIYTGWDAFLGMALLGIFFGAFALRGVALLFRNKI